MIIDLHHCTAQPQLQELVLNSFHFVTDILWLEDENRNLGRLS
jgi:hypothetical protein